MLSFMRITCYGVSDTLGLKILIISIYFQLWIAGNVCPQMCFLFPPLYADIPLVVS